MRPVLLPLLFPLGLLAQEAPQPTNYEPVPSALVVGLGVGQPYGGIGAQLAARPWQQLSIFAGGGYALVGMAYNVGLSLRLMPKSPVCPFLTGMYGYNAGIIVKGTDRYNQLYYGATFGGGLEIHGRRRAERYLSVQLLFPQRPQAFEDDLEAIERNPNVTLEREPWDVTIAVGYHFGR